LGLGTLAVAGTVIKWTAEFYEFYNLFDLAFNAELNAPSHAFINQGFGGSFGVVRS
jgi:hypothetical protein